MARCKSPTNYALDIVCYMTHNAHCTLPSVEYNTSMRAKVYIWESYQDLASTKEIPVDFE